MARRYEAGRRHTPHLAAKSSTLAAGESLLGAPTSESAQSVLRAPNVGLIVALAEPGAFLAPGDAFAKLEQLGLVHELRVPAGVFGQVVASILHPENGARGQAPVQFDEPLLLLDPNANRSLAASQGASQAQSEQGGQSFKSPSSGRFYQRPSPDRPPFIEVGQVIEQGQTVGLLEIMKTFSRISFSGSDLPQKVKVVELLAQDDDELASGDPIFRFESV